ncbi:AN1-type zinc finger protein 2B [Sarcoptes scabiei]|uniref:AN1-type zinc finger protein 2B n=1 Tax=Sarcoptes scabiei TaxID=52283 RepID=A0A132ABB8_SARSC|nr:AN1-type zinc finger protein 2B [Sarcoptes scabiei]KPM07750.1 AN1-type zinc finger protein 2B-like protein [Sarcoptes scabiei]UXI21951.1 protein held out wings-like [Sarcoptes scabiei]
MELPHLGENCSLQNCNKLDFLPIKCAHCKRIFCGDHYQFNSHNCTDYKENQVPICPLCNIPVAIKIGESPDFVISNHIDRNCLEKKELVFKNRCSFPNCKRKELSSIRCEKCKLNWCIYHRHPVDHSCSVYSNDNLGLKKPRETLPNNDFLVSAQTSSTAKSIYGKFQNACENMFKTFENVMNPSRFKTCNKNSLQGPYSSFDFPEFQKNLTEEEAIKIATANSLQDFEKVKN